MTTSEERPEQRAIRLIAQRASTYRRVCDPTSRMFSQFREERAKGLEEAIHIIMEERDEAN